MVPTPCSPSFCSSLVIWLGIFCGSLICLLELCTILLCQLGNPLSVLHFPYSLFNCQNCLFKEHPALLDSFLPISFIFYWFFCQCPTLVEICFPRIDYFFLISSFLFLKKGMLYFFIIAFTEGSNLFWFFLNSIIIEN